MSRLTSDLPFGRPTSNMTPPLKGSRRSAKRASRGLSRFLMTFCLGVAATLGWQSYGDAARQMIASSYPLLSWLAPRAEPVAQSPPNTTALAALGTPSFDQQQLNAMSLNIDAIRQSIDRIAVGHEQIMRSVDQIATRTGQERTTRSPDQTANSSDLSAKANGIMVDSRADGASFEPDGRLDIKQTEAGPPQALSERGKQFPAAGGQDRPCFPSALCWNTTSEHSGP